MKKIILFLSLLLVITLQTAFPQKESKEEHDARMQWWREARFGMFIHWGPVSLTGAELSWSRGAQVPVAEYDDLCKRFNPTKFSADEWVKIAKDAGMKYIVITSKHHDGFALFDSALGDWKTPPTAQPNKARGRPIGRLNGVLWSLAWTMLVSAAWGLR